MKTLTIGDDWLDYAKLLPVGQSRRAFHDCKHGGKLSLVYGNNHKGWWARCYRCDFKDFKSKEHVQYQRPVAPPRRAPTDIVPLINIISERAYLVRKALEQHGLLPYLSMLSVSPTYSRIYLPDDSGSYCGLDYTGTAYAWWHSPTGETLAYKNGNSGTLRIYSEASAYLGAVRSSQRSMFLPQVSQRSLTAAAALILADSQEITTGIQICDHPVAARIRKELAVTGLPVVIINDEG